MFGVFNADFKRPSHGIRQRTGDRPWHISGSDRARELRIALRTIHKLQHIDGCTER